MPIDKEYIEQLVLEEITGVISPEDSDTLKKLLVQEPEAYAIWRDLHRKLTNSYMQSVRDELPVSLPVEEIFRTVRRKKRNRKIFAGVGVTTTLMLAGLLIFIFLRQPVAKAPVSHILSDSLKTVALVLPRGEVVPLGSGQQPLSRSIGGAEIFASNDLLTWQGHNKDSFTIIVPAGLSYRVREPDGSTLYLKGNTKVTFPMDIYKNARRATAEGTLYCEISTDPSNPFELRMPHGTVRVLGTVFRIRTDSSVSSVNLFSGKIQLLHQQDSILLRPGEKAYLQADQSMLLINNKTITENNGEYHFDPSTSTMQDFCRVLCWVHHKKVIFDSPKIAYYPYSDLIEKHGTLDVLLKNIRKSTSLQVYYEKGDTTVLHLK